MAVAWLESYGWEVTMTLTGGKGQATEMARDAVESKHDVVIACGGDGTINEIANGLAGSDTALAVIRGGTANVWAKEIGVPRDPLSAVRLLCEGRRRRVDLGVVEGDGGRQRSFLLMAGVGLDGHVVDRVPEGLKRRLGAAAYVFYGLRESVLFPSQPTSLIVDGESVSADLLWLLAANTRSYGGVIEVAREAVADDGLLDVYVFEGRGLRQKLARGLSVLLRRHEGARGVTHRKAARIDLSPPAELECQVDGERLEFVPRTIRVEPRALVVVLPADDGGALFSGEDDHGRD
jgi:diacylglycerol kinase (ATP)